MTIQRSCINITPCKTIFATNPDVQRLCFFIEAQYFLHGKVAVGDVVLKHTVAAVHGKMFPAAFVAHDNHVGTAVDKREPVICFIQANPCFLCFEIHFFFRSIFRIDRKHAERILTAVLPLHIQGTAIGFPLGPAQLVVYRTVEINPGSAAASGLHKTQFHIGVGVAGFWVAGFFEAAVAAIGVVQREHFNTALIKTHVGKRLAIGAPPKSTEGRWATKNFFPIHPAGIAVQNQIGTILGKTGFFTCSYFNCIQIVIAGKGHKLFVGAESRILLSSLVKRQLFFASCAAQKNVVVFDEQRLLGPTLRWHFIIGSRCHGFAGFNFQNVWPCCTIGCRLTVQYHLLIVEPLQHLHGSIVKIGRQLVFQQVVFGKSLLGHGR